MLRLLRSEGKGMNLYSIFPYFALSVLVISIFNCVGFPVSTVFPYDGLSVCRISRIDGFSNDGKDVCGAFMDDILIAAELTGAVTQFSGGGRI
jgi:hypothetical protein